MPPQIETPPQDQSVPEGANVTFSCTAVGDPPPVLEWRRENMMPLS